MKIFTCLVWFVTFLINIILVFSIPPYSAFDELHHIFMLFGNYPEFDNENFVYNIMRSIGGITIKDFDFLDAHLNPFVRLNPPGLFETAAYYLFLDSNPIIYSLRLIQVGLAWFLLIIFTFLCSKFIKKLPSYLTMFVIPAWLLLPVVWQNIISVGPQFLLIPLAPLIVFLILAGVKEASIACLVSAFFWESDGQSKIFIMYVFIFSFYSYRKEIIEYFSGRLNLVLRLVGFIDFSKNWVFLGTIFSLPLLCVLANNIFLMGFEFIHFLWAHIFYPNFVFLQGSVFQSFAVSFLSIPGFGFSSGKLLPLGFYICFGIMLLTVSSIVLFERKFWKSILPILFLFTLFIALFPGLSNMRYHYFVGAMILVVGSRVTTGQVSRYGKSVNRFGACVLTGLSCFDLAILFHFQYAV